MKEDTSYELHILRDKKQRTQNKIEFKLCLVLLDIIIKVHAHLLVR